MADEREVPEADALEQHLEPDEDAVAEGKPLPPEATEADAVDQHRDVAPTGGDRPRVSPEVPEADAVEQAQVVHEDDDDRTE